MQTTLNTLWKRMFFVALVVFLATAGPVSAAPKTLIEGITGPTFNLTATADHIGTTDGGSYLMWLFADGVGRGQYPGPTLIVNEGDLVTVNLTNAISGPATEPVSIIFPGQTGVTAEGGAAGLITREASFGDALPVKYQFVAEKPGTYLYHSGTHMELQVEMGLLGVLIVRPAGFSSANPNAYGSAESAFDREYLFLITEMDPVIHNLVEFGRKNEIDNTKYWAVYWFLNGRTATDDLNQAHAPWLPTQPYNCSPLIHPGEKLLMRVVNAGRDLHPFHHHGSHADVIAVNGRPASSGAGQGIDLARSGFTITAVPGQTVDAIFQWTGKGLNWDVYGTPADGRPAHDCVDNDGDGFADPGVAGNNPFEYCPDHGKAFPVVLPETQDVLIGAFYAGSPFLGGVGTLPPGEGGLNPYGGFSYMWHSHTEKELTNFDIYPGGLLTMLIVVPWSVDIP